MKQIKLKQIFLLVSLLVVVSGCININLDKTTEGVSTPSAETEEQKSVPVKTEIKVRGENLEMAISPVQDKVIKDAVTIFATKIPSDTSTVGFGIIGPEIESLEKIGPNLGYDRDGNDGWSWEFDTNSYPNGEYTLAAIAFPTEEERQSGEPPLGSAQAKVEIQNPGFSVVEPPANTAPYKVIGGSCQNSLESIEIAKRLNANTISFAPTAGFVDDEDGAVIWEPPEKTATGCRKLIALAHENSMKTVMEAGTINEEDFVIKNYNRQRFIQTRKEMMKSYAAFAKENKVSIFSIASEIDSMASVGKIPNEEQATLVPELSKELIKGVKEVYNGKIAIGLAGVEPDEPEASYYPFEGASIICFSASNSREDQVEASIQNIQKLVALMKNTGQMVGIQEVILCEVYFFPKDADVLFGKTGLNEAMRALEAQQSSFDRTSFQEQEKEFYHRLISEVGPELSGIAINAGSPGPLTIRERLAEDTVAEEFGKWK